jgi:hypothetical protein
VVLRCHYVARWKPVTAEQRIIEIKERYGRDHLVTRFITQAAPEGGLEGRLVGTHHHCLKAVRATQAASSSREPGQFPPCAPSHTRSHPG